MIDFSQPCISRAQAVDEEVRKSLYESLAWMANKKEFSSLRLPSDGELTASPVVFGFYYDLLILISMTDTINDRNANQVVDFINNHIESQFKQEDFPKINNTNLRVSTLTNKFYSPAERDCLIRWIDTEAENSLSLVGLSDEELLLANNNLSKAIKLIDALIPEFLDEMLAITTDIVFAKPSGEQRLTFGGASSFALWGALALNSQAHPNWWHYVPRLIHEYSHNLLFGIARNQPLVLNDSDEIFYSPLRQEPRPMDGIYHAAYVSARESFAMKKILCKFSNQILSQDDRLSCTFFNETLLDSRAAFYDCVSTIEQFGKLSVLGENILINLKASMDLTR